MTATEVRNRINGLPAWLANTVTIGLTSLGATMVDMNVEQMEKEGIDSGGKKIVNELGETTYSPEYAEEKAALGKESRFINLNMEGDFHGAMDFKIDKSGISISSTDPKTDMLTTRYGSDIFGLTISNFDLIVDDLVDYLTAELATYFA